MATFQERFNQLFDESSKSQKEFGQQFGASDDQVYNWRRNRGEPDSETMKRIARGCNVSVSWLVGETDNRRPPDLVVKYNDKILAIEAKTAAIEEVVMPLLEKKTPPELQHLVTGFRTLPAAKKMEIFSQAFKNITIDQSGIRLSQYADPEEAELIKKYKSLSPKRREALQVFIDSFINSPQ